MPERIPTLTIHGVNNRDKDRFENEAVAPLQRALNKRGGNWDLWPVFWGDLGAGDKYLDRTLGDVSDAALADSITPADGEPSTPDAFLACLAAAPVDTYDGAQEAVESAWPTLTVLPYIDGELCQAAAEAYAEALAAPPNQVSESPVAAAEVAIVSIDRLMAKLLRKLRLWVMPNLFRFAGDIAVYASHASQPVNPNPKPPGKLITDRVTLVLKEVRAKHGEDWGTAKRPIPVVAHSLGALILFDMANNPEVDFAIGTMVSFATQVSAIHLLEPRNPPPPFDGNTRLPVGRDNIARWVNLWHPIDWLAFVMTGIFEPGDPSDPHITDIRLDIDGNLDVGNVHSSYWKSGKAADKIAAALRGQVRAK